jgi:hypothetical protein
VVPITIPPAPKRAGRFTPANTKYYDVVDPGGVSRADGLNDKLEIVGRYGNGVFGGTGFKATTKE